MSSGRSPEQTGPEQRTKRVAEPELRTQQDGAMDLMLGIGTLIFVYVLAMWGRPSTHDDADTTSTTASPTSRRRWQLSVDSIPEEDEGCQSDPAECLDSDDDEEAEEDVPAPSLPLPAWRVLAPPMAVGLSAA